MAVKMFCDRCGDETQVKHYVQFGIRGIFDGEKIDLCEKCKSALLSQISRDNSKDDMNEAFWEKIDEKRQQFEEALNNPDIRHW